jgi:hypothetical protein
MRSLAALLTAAAQAQVAPVLIEHDVTVDSELSDRFTWADSGQPRVELLLATPGERSSAFA